MSWGRCLKMWLLKQGRANFSRFVPAEYVDAHLCWEHLCLFTALRQIREMQLYVVFVGSGMTFPTFGPSKTQVRKK